MLRRIIFCIIFIFNLYLIKSAPMDGTQAMIFLKNMGYTNNKTSDEMSNADITNSIKKFQKNFQLPMTGKLDTKTLDFMNKPRCGHPDFMEIRKPKNTWKKNHLTYKLTNTPRRWTFTFKKAKEEVQNAFSIWAKYIPMTFEMKDEGDVDIDIIFQDTKKGDGEGQTLAYAYFPSRGDIYFDDENWTYNSSTKYNFLEVATHEIGHSLGLDHSEVRNSILFPYYSGNYKNIDLKPDDIERIQAAYGSKDICTTPNIDAIFSPKENTLIVIKGNFCWKFEKGKLKSEYPKELFNEFKNIPSKIDSAFDMEGKIYFLISNKLWGFQDSDRLKKYDFSYSGSIAAVAIEHRVYFFQGDKYWRYSINGDDIKKNFGYPKKMSTLWKGVPTYVDNVYYDKDRYIYFFKNKDVYKFDMNTHSTVDSPITLKDYFKCK